MIFEREVRKNISGYGVYEALARAEATKRKSFWVRISITKLMVVRIIVGLSNMNKAQSRYISPRETETFPLRTPIVVFCLWNLSWQNEKKIQT